MPVFLAWLNIKATEHARAYPEVLNLEDVQNLKTFLQFDSKVTLPVFGFETAEVLFFFTVCSLLFLQPKNPSFFIETSYSCFDSSNLIVKAPFVGGGGEGSLSSLRVIFKRGN